MISSFFSFQKHLTEYSKHNAYYMFDQLPQRHFIFTILIFLCIFVTMVKAKQLQITSLIPTVSTYVMVKLDDTNYLT